MTALNASTVPLAVRIKNARYDGLITGYLHGAPKFVKTDPGGFRSGSFTIDQRLAHRSDIIQPYSRVYFYNKRNGDCVFEGDITHPGRSTGANGELLEVQIEGGVERLNDWSGPRIYVDRDMTAWTKTGTAAVSTVIQPGEDRGGSGLEALELAFPMDTHVENNHRAEAGYFRLAEASQDIGRIDYTWDGGHTSGSPGWQVRTIVTPPSTVVRTQTLNVSGSTSDPQTVDDQAGGTIPAGSEYAYVQLIWTSGSSSTGTTGADICWVCLKGLVICSRLKTKTGAFKSSGYNNGVTAVEVWEDLLGDMLATTFDGPGASLAAGSGVEILHFIFPDGVTPMGIADELMKYEPKCTYIVGPSDPTSGKYSLTWLERTPTVRYEFVTWTDEHSGGIQPADQFNEVVSRWKTPVGNIRFTNSTQSIPEMTAAGRTRRYFQDLGQISGDATNAVTANAVVLEEHRYPSNGGRVRVQREVVDLFTGRRVQPYEIEPGYLCRVVGVDPHPDALNATESNGASVCRIVTTDYSADDHAVDLDLDSVPWSMFRAIAKAAKKPRPLPSRIDPSYTSR